MLAHLGSPSSRSMRNQWRSAFRRHSSMNSGSPLRAEISRTMSSFSPLGTRSSSMLVTKPHLYSCSASPRIVSTSNSFDLHGIRPLNR